MTRAAEADVPERNPTPPPAATAVAVIGDVHGHLQLALCMAARWQQELGVRFEAVFLCGDVGTFTDPAQLDSATRSHARDNRCELEFMEQWAVHPPAPWLAKIFEPAEPEGDGLGLCCPVVMVHGNHEGFAHLETLFSRRHRPIEPVPIDALRGADAGEFIRYLPSGWRTVTPSGTLVGGVGGMEAGQRRSKYHPMAYIDEEALLELLDAGPLDLLITHQGPAAVQSDRGSPTLDELLERRVARVWFHGHGARTHDVTPVGACTVVPLGDVAFPGKGRGADDPGLDGWAWVSNSRGALTVHKETPPFWREFRRTRWTQTPGGRLVSPPLARFLH